MDVQLSEGETSKIIVNNVQVRIDYDYSCILYIIVLIITVLRWIPVKR